MEKLSTEEYDLLLEILEELAWDHGDAALKISRLHRLRDLRLSMENSTPNE